MRKPAPAAAKSTIKKEKRRKRRHLLELIDGEALQVDGIGDGVEERSRLQRKVCFCQCLRSAAKKTVLLRRL